MPEQAKTYSIKHQIYFDCSINSFLCNILDKDECAMENPCDVNAVCYNTDGSYVCRCNSGFSGYGWDCTGSYIDN